MTRRLIATRRARILRGSAVLSIMVGTALFAGAASPAVASPTISAVSAGTFIAPAPISPVSFPASSTPYAAAVTPNSAAIYVADSGTNKVTAVNASTGATTSIALSGVNPEAVAISPDGATVYVADYTTGIVERIATATNTLITPWITLGVSTSPVNIAVSPDGSRLYAVEQGTDKLEAFSLTPSISSLGTVSLGVAPRAVAISRDGKTAYVTGGGGAEGYVDVIDTTALSAATPVDLGAAGGPLSIALSPDGATLYVGNNSTSTIQSMSTATKAVSAPVTVVGSGPSGVGFSPDGKWLYVSFQGDQVTVFSTSDLAVLGRFQAGNAAGVEVSPDGKRVYVPDLSASKLAAFDVLSLGISGPGQITPGAATTDFDVAIEDAPIATVGDYSTQTISVDILDAADAAVSTVSGHLSATTGTVTLSVPTGSLPAGVYSVRATFTDAISGGTLVAAAGHFVIGAAVATGTAALAATGVNAAALAATGVNAVGPAAVGGALLLIGGTALAFSRRKARPRHAG